MRQQSGLTQKDMAAALGISRSSVGMYENGEREPDFRTLEKIADYFNVKMSSLIEPRRESPQDDMIDRIVTYFYHLNNAGQAEALSRIEELTELSKYRKE